MVPFNHCTQVLNCRNAAAALQQSAEQLQQRTVFLLLHAQYHAAKMSRRGRSTIRKEPAYLKQLRTAEGARGADIARFWVEHGLSEPGGAEVRRRGTGEGQRVYIRET